MLQAGASLYGATTNGIVMAIDLKSQGDMVWQTTVEGTPWSLLAADNKLFVVTRQGMLYAFGAEPRSQPRQHAIQSQPATPTPARLAERARQLIRAAGTDTGGVAVILGIEDGELIRALAQLWQGPLIGIDSDEKKIDALRQAFTLQGLYGSRVHLLPGDAAAVEDLPPYLATLIATEQVETAPFAQEPGRVFRVLRPYGGTAWLPATQPARDAISRAMAHGGLERAEVMDQDGALLLRRAGPLPGAADWTHEYADAAHTAASQDKLVSLPLGVLWFGGPPHDPILPRHGHGPSPQVAGGRLFIEGRDILRAIDVYTGRLLWDRELTDIGKFYDNTAHQPGASEIGANYVSLPDAVYVVAPQYCLRLDPLTGRTVREFSLPLSAGQEHPAWGSIRVWQDLLVATTAPLSVPVWDEGDIPPEHSSTLIARRAEWQYWTRPRPADAWTQPEFNAEGWSVGPAGFGYGYGAPTDLMAISNRSAAVFLRHAFELDAGYKPERLNLLIRYDDAFVAYLNGREVLRTQVVHERDSKKIKVGRHEARRYEEFEIPGSLLRRGRNVLAIEGHNISAGDSDFLIDPYLVVQHEAAEAPQEIPDVYVKLGDVPGVDLQAEYASASRMLAVLSRETGETLWTRPARQEFRHNAIVAGAGKIFCIDGLSATKAAYLRRRGHPAGAPVLLALDARTGRELWRQEQGIFGTWLAYSEAHDVLLEASARGRDRPMDEAPRGMAVYRGGDGARLWRDDTLVYSGPCMLRHDRIITQDRAFELLTGKACLRIHPLTGHEIPWSFRRNYGCGTARAGEHLLTFRSAAAGFFDLVNGGTGNFGGFRSGCTANLIPADGLLNAPDYTRTCTCRYQIQTSLAMVSMPDMEKWTFDTFGEGSKDIPNIRRIGVNFGAPGDRMAQNGSLWLAYPNRGWPSPNVQITADGTPRFFTRHASSVTGELPWVAASGMDGATSVTVRLQLRPSVASVSREFGVRWEGSLLPPVTGSYTFHVQARDGFRLLLDKKPLMDFWTPRWFAAEDSATIDLKAGRPVAFRLEFYNKTGSPSLNFAWTPPEGEKMPLPLSCLLSAKKKPELLTVTYFDRPDLSGRSVKQNEPGILSADWNNRAPPALLKLRTEPEASRKYPVSPGTVRLYFAEPYALLPGERVFDVVLHDRVVMKDLDIVAETGAPNRLLVREFNGIPLGRDLRVGLIPKTGRPLICGLEAWLTERQAGE